YVRPCTWLRYRCSSLDKKANSFALESPSGRYFCVVSNFLFRMTSSMDHRTRFEAAIARAYRSVLILACSIVACMAHSPFSFYFRFGDRVLYRKVAAILVSKQIVDSFGFSIYVTPRKTYLIELIAMF